MENKSSNSLLVKLIIAAVLLVIFISAAFGTIFFLKPSLLGKLPFTAPTQKPDSKTGSLKELDLLTDYYSKNRIPYPPDYKTSDVSYYKALALRPAVIEREVSWKSGVLFSVNSLGGNEEKAVNILQTYRDKVVRGESLRNLINQINSDSEVLNMDKGQEQSYFFNHTTRDRKLFLDNKILETFFNASAGTISEITTDNITKDTVFYIITGSFSGKYPTYTAWLQDVSGGQITETPTR